ncbi:GDSL-like lipase/Acylhydrolase family protein [Hirsutella rhossiliensis]|uniref:GDSL-like lipase/Acylhydrolase family domain-containing protein n=1 Tax=Hirsutella rhossiliensis TaxID=111463 RepID=A0A9P8SN10_9HYPO|nr:GDSL-like lipase/Acylhydrolase family domain-containing protein [Hirsutella rhossiliensis]KAH0967879.1 GDSL-like lipase/Acylhydrolase family domain-containing protein [Hirsutella rhossiliensis]
MLLRVLLLLIGLAAVASRSSPDISPGFDFGAAARSISAELSSPSFAPYSRPAQRVEEFIAVGDSYTAGTGCNGNNEILAGDAVRGKRSYPMQMSTDKDSWAFINGDEALPRFSFPAYTGDTSVQLVSEQLKQGDYKENNQELPRGQPFGKPQVAFVTIGGNDAMLSDILNACIYRGWFPKDCQTTLGALQKDIDDGSLRDKINYALYEVAHAGRQAGGANPREGFQVYVLSYVTFFNDVNPECDEISWNYWSWSEPKLTTQLRRQLNGLTTKVNELIKAAAKELEPMGVIFVDGLEDAYKGHRYCEPGHTNQEMVDYDTWFWSSYAHVNTPSEGPGDPHNAYSSGNASPAQQLLDFVFPGKNHSTAQALESSPPWEWEGASKFPSLQDLQLAVRKAQEDPVTAMGAPFNLLRSFHPKGTAYAEHKTLLFAAMANNRDFVTSGHGGANYTQRCKDWEIKEDRLLVGTCKDKAGNEKRTQEALDLCLRYDNGALIPADKGQFQKDCHGCFFNPEGSGDHSKLWCVCRNDKDPFAKDASIKLDDLMTVQDDGYVKCLGHISAPARR